MATDTSCIQTSEVTYSSLFSYQNLVKAYKKCRKNVDWKRSVQSYTMNYATRLARLYLRLQNHTYKPKPYKHFKVNERGKTREISALHFEDRIVHKCFCDNFLYPLLSRKLNYDSGATIKKKGLSFTERRTICQLQKYYRKYGNKGYVLKLDIHHYFENIDHTILFDKFRQIIKDDDIYNFLVSQIPANTPGLGLGSQISQISAMYYLNELDHNLKERQHAKFYNRYMDDLYILSPDKTYLRQVLKIIKSKLAELNLTVNPDKTRIIPLEYGFVFCKTKYILTDTGKVLRLITSNSIKSMKRKIKLHINIENILPSWYSYLSKFDCHNRIMQFFNTYKGEAYYEQLNGRIT